MRLHLSILLYCIASTSSAASWPFDEAPYAWIGADYQLINRNNGMSTFCHGRAADTANIGIGQTILRRDRYTIAAEYRHHSCISQSDDYNGYDAIGVMIKFKFW